MVNIETCKKFRLLEGEVKTIPSFEEARNLYERLFNKMPRKKVDEEKFTGEGIKNRKVEQLPIIF